MPHYAKCGISSDSSLFAKVSVSICVGGLSLERINGVLIIALMNKHLDF